MNEQQHLTTFAERADDLRYSSLRTFNPHYFENGGKARLKEITGFLNREHDSAGPFVNNALGNFTRLAFAGSLLSKIFIEPGLPPSQDIPDLLAQLAPAFGGLSLNSASLRLDTTLGATTALLMGITTIPTVLPGVMEKITGTLDKHTIDGVADWLIENTKKGEMTYVGDPENPHELVLGVSPNDAIEATIARRTNNNYIAVGEDWTDNKSGFLTTKAVVNEFDWENILVKADLANCKQITVSPNHSGDIVLPGPDNVDFTPAQLLTFLMACDARIKKGEKVPPIKILGDISETVDGTTFSAILDKFKDKGLQISSHDLTQTVFDHIGQATNSKQFAISPSDTNQRYQTALAKKEFGQNDEAETGPVTVVYDQTDEAVYTTYSNLQLTQPDCVALFMNERHAQLARDLMIKRFVQGDAKLVDGRDPMFVAEVQQFIDTHIFVVSEIVSPIL